VAQWTEFSRLRPDLAQAGTELLYQFGLGLAFHATSRADGGPRAHPICPLLTISGLFAFIVPSPKREDLIRDGRYAMHSFPSDDDEDAFFITGRAHRVVDEEVRAALADQYARERGMTEPPADLGAWTLFSFDVETCLLTRTTGHGDPAPKHTVWHE
jgi:hypothetical protein